MNDLVQLVLLASIGSFVALAGGVVFLFNKKLSNLLSTNSIPFAAGVLITVALVGLLPEATHLIGEQAFLVVLFSFLMAYLFEHLLFGLHHHDETCKHNHHGEVRHQTSIPFVIFGDSIHNFIDGVAIGAAFLVNPGLGLVTAISTFLHEVPHEIGDFGIMLKNGWSKRKILLVNIFTAALTLVGALLVFYLPIDEYIIGILMAVSAGIFLYLGASDFLPQIEETQISRFAPLFPLILGVFVMLGTLMLVPHSHETHEDEHEDHMHELHEEDEHHEDHEHDEHEEEHEITEDIDHKAENNL